MNSGGVNDEEGSGVGPEVILLDNLDLAPTEVEVKGGVLPLRSGYGGWLASDVGGVVNTLSGRSSLVLGVIALWD